jgi:hypothetical protein
VFGDSANFPTLGVLRFDEVAHGVALAMRQGLSAFGGAPLGNSLPAWVLCDFPPDGK